MLLIDKNQYMELQTFQHSDQGVKEWSLLHCAKITKSICKGEIRRNVPVLNLQYIIIDALFESLNIIHLSNFRRVQCYQPENENHFTML